MSASPLLLALLPLTQCPIASALECRVGWTHDACEAARVGDAHGRQPGLHWHRLPQDHARVRIACLAHSLRTHLPSPLPPSLAFPNVRVLAVARGCGIDESALPASNVDDIFQLTYSQAPSILKPGQEPNLTKDFKPSLLVDLEANRGMELSPIIENVVRKGEKHGIDTPRLELILAALRPSLMKTVRAKKSGPA